MTDNEKQKPLISSLATSEPFYELCAKKVGAKMQIESWANNITVSIIYAFNQLKENFDRQRNQYNDQVDVNARLHLTPNIKVSNYNERRHLSIRWGRLENGAYRGNFHQTKTKWVIREVQKRGKNHYSEAVLNKALNHNNRKCLPLLLETEQAMIFLRNQYSLVNEMYKTGKKVKFSLFEELLIKPKINHRSETEKTLFCKMSNELKTNTPTFDPLGLSKKQTLVEFCNHSDVEVETEEFREDLDDFDWSIKPTEF